VPLVLMEQLEPLDLPVSLDLQVQPELQVPLVLMEQLEPQDLPV
jgi:hypothetical protein